MGQERQVLNECTLLRSCDHPFVVVLHRVFCTPHHVHLLLELTSGGELFDTLRAAGSFEEGTARFYSAIVVSCFRYLHEQRIAYRDLKPENLLLEASGYLRLVDFGFAKRLDAGGRTWTVCGTPEYMAPEIILNQGHNKAVDWWTTGIIIFEMLVGFPPFEANDPMELYKAIVQNNIKWPHKVSQTAQGCIAALLRSGPADRLGSGKQGAEGIKKDPFFKKIVAWQSLVTKKIEAPYKPQLKDDLDVSQFDDFDDPDIDDPPQDVKKGMFDEFKRIAAQYEK